MAEHIKFISVTRVIDPKTRIHYLDAVDTNGTHWMCQMEHDIEPHLCYKRVWYRDPQQPWDL